MDKAKELSKNDFFIDIVCPECGFMLSDCYWDDIGAWEKEAHAFNFQASCSRFARIRCMLSDKFFIDSSFEIKDWFKAKEVWNNGSKVEIWNSLDHETKIVSRSLKLGPIA